MQAEKDLVAKAPPLMKQADAGGHQLLKLIQAKDQEGLKAFTAKGMYEAIDPIGGVLDQLIGVQLDVAKGKCEASQTAYQQTIWTIIALTALALLAGTGLAWPGTSSRPSWDPSTRPWPWRKPWPRAT